MDSEGRGRIPPTPIKLVFSSAERRSLLQCALAIRKNRREWQGKGWKGGLKRGEHMRDVGWVRRDVRPIYLGLGGEYAVAVELNRLLRVPVFQLDATLRPAGDMGTDLSAYGLTIQVKTRTRRPSLVRRVSNHKKLVHLDNLVFAFCEWNGNDALQVLGWQWTEHLIRHCPLIKSSVAEHWNLRVHDNELKPLGNLAAELEGRCCAVTTID